MYSSADHAFSVCKQLAFQYLVTRLNHCLGLGAEMLLQWQNQLFR